MYQDKHIHLLCCGVPRRAPWALTHDTVIAFICEQLLYSYNYEGLVWFSCNFKIRRKEIQPPCSIIVVWWNGWLLGNKDLYEPRGTLKGQVNKEYTTGRQRKNYPVRSGKAESLNTWSSSFEAPSPLPTDRTTELQWLFVRILRILEERSCKKPRGVRQGGNYGNEISLWAEDKRGLRAQ